MSTPDGFSRDSGVGNYLPLPPAADSERLDAMHETLTRYLGDKLGPALLNDLHPRKILELGCGSGAWAIQAAIQFSDAEVVAVDQSPLPDRILPPNLKFHRADLAQKLEFEDETFDIVHARLVLSHLVDATDTLRCASRLVKPGGLLLIEDVAVVSLAKYGGPATRQIIDVVKAVQDRVGAPDCEFGSKIEPIIMSLCVFSDIQVKKVSIPFGGTGDDEALNELGLGMKKSFSDIWKAFADRLQDQGLTRELVYAYDEEQERLGNKTVLDMYFCSARRSQ
ncbi:S-adenosyl-L-methionine-dependent methyltransferase [Mycena sanguinolenta]|nr:S-adenosyl-L-methionine-dependent methyltransferase [Mycena sanguinolenta]